MTELIVFIVVGGLAVAFATLMLLSENAVHSALSLIVTMVCIAVLFLALNAPFLAMIQITVYAGAIMVLFLFVIMLLGAERLLPASPGEGKVRYRWFAPLALTLAMSLLIAAGVTIIQGQGGSLDAPGPNPIIRAVNLASTTETLSVTANGVNVGDALASRQPSRFTEIAPGEYDISAVLSDGSSFAASATLASGIAYTVVGFVGGELAVIPEDLSTIAAERSARFALFNGTDETLSLVDRGSEFVDDDDRVVIAEIAPGTLSETVTLGEGVGNWAVVLASAPDTVWFALRDYEIVRDRSTTLIAAHERNALGELRPLVLPLDSEARPAFGSPRAIGYSLFTDFLLPFQLLAVLLLASMVGVIVLTHRDTGKRMPTVANRRRVSRPLANVIAAQVGSESASERGDAALPEPEQPQAVGK